MGMTTGDSAGRVCAGCGQWVYAWQVHECPGQGWGKKDAYDYTDYTRKRVTYAEWENLLARLNALEERLRVAADFVTISRAEYADLTALKKENETHRQTIVRLKKQLFDALTPVNTPGEENDGT